MSSRRAAFAREVNCAWQFGGSLDRLKEFAKPGRLSEFADYPATKLSRRKDEFPIRFCIFVFRFRQPLSRKALVVSNARRKEVKKMAARSWTYKDRVARARRNYTPPRFRVKVDPPQRCDAPPQLTDNLRLLNHVAEPAIE
jgi:hypothetical protein